VDLTLCAGWQIESAPCAKPFDVFEHVPGVRLEGRLPQPSKPGQAAFFLACEQLVQPTTMGFCKLIGQLLVDTAVGTCDRLRADTLDRVQAWQQDAPFPQHLDQPHRQHTALVRLHRNLDQLLDRQPMMNRRERLKLKECLKFDQMLSPGLSATAVLGPMLNRNL